MLAPDVVFSGVPIGLPAMTEPASLTAYVAEFIIRTKATSIPADVMHLGKRSILDGLGLALAGNAAESGHIVRSYLKSLGIPTDKGATVIGTSLKVPARFAAFANGIAIHADDYDDTQLAVAKDRVYGLLTHPTAPALPPVRVTVIVAVGPLSATLYVAALNCSVPAMSLSVMVSTAVLGVPSVAPPVGALSATFTVSFASTAVSLTIGMVTVLLAVSPAAKLTVWLTAV